MAAAMGVWWALQRPLPERGEYVIVAAEERSRCELQ
jgi:hypothetical protein